MKKNLLLAAALFAISFTGRESVKGIAAETPFENAGIAEEYTFYYSGETQGIVTITKDAGGKITILPMFSKKGWGASCLDIPDICPIVPKSFKDDFYFGLVNHDKIVIDGNTTTATGSYAGWKKIVVMGNTTTRTNDRGEWATIVVDGNTTLKKSSMIVRDYMLFVTEIGTEKPRTSAGLGEEYWLRTVVNGNTTLKTSSTGNWQRTVVNGNTAITTSSSMGEVSTTVTTAGNKVTKTTTGYWTGKEVITTVVEGNIKTITKENGEGEHKKIVIERQGNDIFINTSGDGYFRSDDPWDMIGEDPFLAA